MVKFNRVIPVLRMFDPGKAREFYVTYLGMTIDWEHRFEPGLPLYMQVSRGDLVLHLSEHHGDGTPGTVVYVDTTDVVGLHAELYAKQYSHLSPDSIPMRSEPICRSSIPSATPSGSTSAHRRNALPVR